MTKKLINNLDNTYVRIMTSKLHGVGVFAIKDIPKGTLPFQYTNSKCGINKFTKIHKDKLEGIDKSVITKYGYANHIERLMFLGNYLLLLMIDPKDVYEIFMEWTIDAYEWVMVPNVFCMSQFADGGLIMTRPYFSSSNYILKMSNYRKGEWSKIFDNIYYNFISNHVEYLQKNYSTSRQVSHWKKKIKVINNKLLMLQIII
jgi:deoxyribodipyrimidine photolyase-like uncharacterized protein